ncbi:MAG: U32 family peptidase [Patescibacteria group bacterium]|nr:U32 family peptidase C-terminal domain-containing protein [Patescibacteria group bacterium]
MQKPELVAPAGDLQKLQYAYRYGADACYVGMPAFSLRSKTTKFKEQEEILEGRELARELNKKYFVTTNIYPHNAKISAFEGHVKWLADEVKPDALIAADPGVISVIKEVWPEARIHLSVQANAVNYRSVRFWYEQGVTRVVLPRELHIEEIAEIKKQVPEVELEVFVHGAICVAYSGRCLLSNYMCYRDPNQGACAQACRFKYKLLEEKPSADALDLKGKNIVLEESMRPGEYMPISEDEHGTYIMNARDICLLPYVAELADIGVDAFKIEGRSKTAYYVASVCRLYRDAIDNGFKEEMMEEIYKISSRGYTPGFLKGDLKEFSMRYEENLAISKARFIGIVKREIADGQWLVDVKNRFDGGEIEIVLPDKVVALEVKEMRKVSGEAQEVVHGGDGDRVFLMDGEGFEGGLLRVSV